MSKISGEGGRIHAVEQAASLHHLADELSNDLKRQGAILAAGVYAEVLTRIDRLRRSAREIEISILEYDQRHPRD